MPTTTQTRREFMRVQLDTDSLEIKQAKYDYHALAQMRVTYNFDVEAMLETLYQFALFNTMRQTETR
jgi:hypothetical protein